jgi:hypothetical protein
MTARQPLRIQQRQRTGLHGDALLGAEHAMLQVGGVDVERDRARISRIGGRRVLLRDRRRQRRQQRQGDEGGQPTEALAGHAGFPGVIEATPDRGAKPVLLPPAIRHASP